MYPSKSGNEVTLINAFCPNLPGEKSDIIVSGKFLGSIHSSTFPGISWDPDFQDFHPLSPAENSRENSSS